jgi:hypothetical protein
MGKARIKYNNMNLNQNIYIGLANLHDVFLNASLIKKQMDNSPIESSGKRGAEIFLASDRGRFERIWIAFLYVLVEAWDSRNMKSIKDYIASKVSINVLTSLIDQGKKDGSLNKMKNTRHYIAHRDNREYWDVGRLSVLGQFEYHLKLHNTFSEILLVAMEEMNKESKK